MLVKMRRKTRKVVAHTSLLAQLVVRSGGVAFFEWPESCDGWDQSQCPEIKGIVSAMPHRTRADGCQLGLRNSTGVAMKKR